MRETANKGRIEGKSNLGEFMRGVRIILSRELGAIFDSSIAYIYFIAFTVLTAAIFMNDFFILSVVDMTPYFKMLPLVSIVFIPALTMRVWAEEKRQMTFELLMTLPMNVPQIVIGKYLSVLLFHLVTLAGSAPIVVMLYWLGEPDGGLIFSGYLGAVFLGAVFIAFGMFASGLTDNQIVAFVLAAFTGFFFVFTGNEVVVSRLDGLSQKYHVGTFLYENISVVPHYDALVNGVLGGGALFYFAAMSIAFLWMNGISVSRSKI
ncbi:ABC transporter permease [bacterium]